MRNRLCLILALLSTVVLGAWADGASSFGGGDGSVKDPYIIKTAEHWNQFASDVNGGNTYSGSYFLLDYDITVTTMVGTGTSGNNAKPFCGTFDGGGHTLTFNYDGSGDDIAPFRFIRNALVTNLHVAGQIKTSGRHAGGLACRTYGTTRIVGCRVSTVILSSHQGDGTHGGIVALKPDWSSAHLTIEGCVYDGKIVTTNGTTLCGGFVGYTSYGSLTIKNSIYAPAAAATGETAVNSEYTFYRYNDKHPGTLTLTNSYYTKPLGYTQGKQAHSIGFPPDVDITVVPTGDVTEYQVSGITGYAGNQCVKYNGVVYAGNEDVVTLTFTHNYVGSTVKNYKVIDNDATLTYNATEGYYTLTMANTDVIIGFSMVGPGYYQLEGNGTADSPYIINSTDVWDYIVSLVNYGQKYFSDTDGQESLFEYATAYYKLTEDIEVETMMGSENHKFKGHFDGNGHTLTVNYNSNEQFAAPFRYVEGAVISNLRVAGTITTEKKFAAGFVANAKGYNTMTNCRSSVTINSIVNGDGTHGGFVAINTEGTFKMEGCTFDGSLLGSETNNCGGFVGWNETNGSTEGVVYFKNCFLAPTSITVDIGHTYARSRINDGARVQMYSSFCRTNFGDNQQIRVYSISAGNGVTVETPQSPVNTYNVSGITMYDTGVKFDGALYAKEDQYMSLNLGYTGTGTLSGFAPTAGTLSGDINPFTLSMTHADAVINATLSDESSGWSGSGKGTSSSPYVISTTAQWDEFANNVNNGVFGFAGAYYQLAASITVSTMVGTDGHKFKGNFDGNGYTLTLNYGTDQSPISENYCAPFRYIEGADIHDLVVGGTIYTKNMFAASIAGFALNDNTITDCRSSVTINSSFSGDGTHGGFVANCQNNDDGATYVTFTRCAFDGTLIGTTTYSWGGFVGWTEGNDWAGVKFIECLFAPSKVNVNTDDCATFSRGRENNNSHISVNNCYYTQSLGAMQGEMAYKQKPDNTTSEAITIAGVTVFVKKIFVTDVAATNITPTTATIGWTGSDACSNYQVRYRVKQNQDVYSTDFEDGMPNGWTMFDNDDDEPNWTYSDGEKKGMAHSGNCCMYSASYINNYGAMEPDNWLVSPPLTLSGTMKVWLKGQDGDEYREHFAIYLSLTGNSKNDFVDEKGNLINTVITLVPETETTCEYQEYTADLSAYNGQNKTGYIAIRHFNCYDEFYLVLDDFSIYDDNAGGEWMTMLASTSGTTTITDLEPDTDYEYQVEYQYDGKTFYTPTATLTTLNANIAPFDLSATGITANTAIINWTGYGDSYNLFYNKGGEAKVTLSVPNDIWDDGSGYQMLLDANHNTFGNIIPESGGLTTSGDALDEIYDYFECKIPENADGNLGTKNVVDGTNGNKSVTITIPAGTYDWCITNPSPNDRVWIASEKGNVGGRQDDFVFEGGKHYTFTVTLDPDDGSHDHVDMTIENDTSLDPGDVTTITGITTTSYTLSDLTALTNYIVYVQTVVGEKSSEWSSMLFSTLDATNIGLLDDGDNSGVIAANIGQQRNVTLVGRTFYKDNNWNTLCLPFAVTDGDETDGVTFSGTLLEGATVLTFDNATFENSALTLNFKEVTVLDPGKPYLIKWANNSEQPTIVNPVFNGVTISNTTTSENVVTSGIVSFKGQYAPLNISENNGETIFYLGSGNTFYYPNDAMTIGSCRAYFQINTNLGDVNGDGTISVTDMTMIVDYILGESNDNFIVENADINCDGSISVADVMALVNIILGDNSVINIVVNGTDGLTFGAYGSGPARVSQK